MIEQDGHQFFEMLGFCGRCGVTMIAHTDAARVIRISSSLTARIAPRCVPSAEGVRTARLNVAQLLEGTLDTLDEESIQGLLGT